MLVYITVTMQLSGRVVPGLLNGTGVVRSLTVPLLLPTEELRLKKKTLPNRVLG